MRMMNMANMRND